MSEVYEPAPLRNDVAAEVYEPAPVKEIPKTTQGKKPCPFMQMTGTMGNTDDVSFEIKRFNVDANLPNLCEELYYHKQAAINTHDAFEANRPEQKYVCDTFLQIASKAGVVEAYKNLVNPKLFLAAVAFTFFTIVTLITVGVLMLTGVIESSAFRIALFVVACLITVAISTTAIHATSEIGLYISDPKAYAAERQNSEKAKEEYRLKQVEQLKRAAKARREKKRDYYAKKGLDIDNLAHREKIMIDEHSEWLAAHRPAGSALTSKKKGTTGWKSKKWVTGWKLKPGGGIRTTGHWE